MKRPDLLQPSLNGAFLKDGFGRGPSVAPTSSRLDGMRLAVKDVFDVAGMRTGAGNPAWWQDRHAATSSAYAVSMILAEGAQWVGKTVTDELAYSLSGSNVHYGTPVNPADSRRIPGGSSSGSAVAVAAGDADIGLATDCGGSARLPASYCGVWGIRPTHGYAGQSGFVLAPSFDTVGWFTRTGSALAKVLDVLVPGLATQQAKRLLIPDDALAVCDPPVQAALQQVLKQLDGAAAPLARGSLPLDEWAEAYRILAGAEIWKEHGPWVTEHGMHLAEDVRARFLAASQISEAERSRQQEVRANAIRTFDSLFRDDCFVLLPSAPGPAPLRDAPHDMLAQDRRRIQKLVSAAGLAGLPQVSMPWIEVDGGPVGLSIIGPKGADAAVIEAAMRLEKRLETTSLVRTAG